MKHLAFVLAAIGFFGPSVARAQAPMVFGVVFDKTEAKKIGDITPGSPADKAGLLPGDMMTAINGVSTSGLTNIAIRAALTKQASASVTINRGGQSKTISMSKVPLDSFGRTCVSGNCETGFGRLRMANYGNLEYEGQFEDGVPKGEFKIYDERQALLYKGHLKYFVADGSGKAYDKDGSGADVIVEEGDYNNGDLYNGIRYKPDGTVLSLGQYEPGPERKQKSVYRMTTYCGRTCNIFVDSIHRGPDGAIYEGKVTIRELESDNPEARKLLEVYFTNGIPNGNAKVWDYANGVYHFMQYRNGVLREDGLNAGMIKRISDDRPLAMEVKYAADASTTNNWQNRIASGLFHFGDKFVSITSPNGGSPLSVFKQLYDGGSGVVFDPNAPQQTSSGSGSSSSGFDGATRGADLMTGVDPGHSLEDVMTAVKECIRIGEAAKAQTEELANIWNSIGRNNYDRARSRFEALQAEIVATYTEALYKYKGAIPSKLWFAMERKRNEIKALQVPAYVQF